MKNAFKQILMVGAATAGVAAEVNMISYNGWNEVVELRNDTVRVVVVPAIGRIMHYSFLNEQNVLYTNPDMSGLTLVPGEVYQENGKPAGLAFGGDRVVTIPENLIDEALHSRINTDPWIDGRPHEFHITGNSVTIQSPSSRLLGIKIIRTIRLAPRGTTVKIEQTMTKVQQAETEFLDKLPLTLWNLTQINPPQQTWQPVAENSVFENGIYIAPWSVSRLDGRNDSVRDGMLRLRQPSNESSGRKICTDSRGWVAGWTGGVLMTEHFEYVEGAQYPEGGTSASVYMNSTFAELECMSPQKILAVGDSIDYSIRWTLQRAEDEAAAEALLRQY